MINDDNLERLRKRAEAAVGEGDLNEFIANASVTDYKSALAEMAIYQAELLAQHEDLQEANARASSTVRKLSELLNLMPDPYFVLDSRLHIIEFNRAAELTFDPIKLEAFDGFDALFKREDRALIKVWLVDDSTDKATIDVDGVKKESGRAELQKQRFDDGTLLVIARDISDVDSYAKTSEHLRHTLKRVEQLQREREVAFSFLAHEMRTPAASIAMLLETDKALSETESGRLIQANIKQVLSVMDDLRVVVKPDAKVFKELSTVDLQLLVEEAVASLGPLFERHKITPHLKLSGEQHTTVLANIQSIKQVLTNLLTNAALHSKGSDLWVSLSVMQLQSSASVVIRVRDNGRGVPADERELIFAPFTRGRAAAEGTGIGLTVCRRLAKQMKGSVTLDEVEGGGSEFVFSFYTQRTEVSKSDPKEADHNEPLRGESVLFVDDDLVIRQLSKKILEHLGAEVHLAADGEEALTRSRTHDYSLVITDIMMPKLDGLGFTKALRGRGYDGRIIGCSAATVGEELDAILAAGADAALPKPLSSSALLTALAGIKRS